MPNCFGSAIMNNTSSRGGGHCLILCSPFCLAGLGFEPFIYLLLIKTPYAANLNAGNLPLVKPVVDRLLLQKQTINNGLNQRKISGIKIGGVWRFDKQEVDKWLKSQSRKAKR